MRKIIAGVLGIAALSAAGAAQAQLTARDMGLTTDELIEGGRLFLSAEVGATYTDNFYYTTQRTDDAFGLLVKPGVAWLFGMPRFSFGLSTSAEAGYFNQPGSEDNYIDALARLRADWQPSELNQFSYTYAYTRDHDPFGTERTEGSANIDQPLDKWDYSRFEAGYHFGTSGLPVALDVKAITGKKAYLTNRDATVFLDHHHVGGQVTLFYNYSPKTSFLIDGVGTRTRMEEVASGTVDRGSNEYRYRAGVRWLATAKTTGDVRVGYLQRNAIDPRLEETTGFDWQVALGWTPQTNQLYSFQTGRSTRESYRLDVDYLDTQYYTLEWAHEWTPSFRTKASGGYADTDFVGTSRSDEGINAGLQAEYFMWRELALIGSASYGQRETNRSGLDYDRFSSYVGVRYVR